MTNETQRGWRYWRPKLKWFAAEFLVVVTGVMVALALGAFFQQRQNGKSEEVYLSLLSRDMQHTVSDLEEAVTFEQAQLRDGIAAYRTISGKSNAEQQRAASLAMQRLMVRRTLRLKNGTYQDLISTGNLRLIRNRALRDSIVDFFEGTSGLFDIINKNNSFFVDDMYNSTFVGQGLILPTATLGNLPALAPIDREVLDSLGSGYADQPDRLWSLPPDAREWAEARSTLMTRIRVSALAQRFAGNLLKDTRALKTAIDAERARFQ